MSYVLSRNISEEDARLLTCESGKIRWDIAQYQRAGRVKKVPSEKEPNTVALREQEEAFAAKFGQQYREALE
jgi:hypothetical protein